MLDQLFRGEKYTADELNARLKFFVGIILGLTLFGIVFVVLYSLIFVTQPMNSMSPVDNKFFELIIPIATFLTGTLSGIMLAGGDKEAQMKALEAATAKTPPAPPTLPAPSYNSGFTTSNSFAELRSTEFAAPMASRSFSDWSTTAAPMTSSKGKLGPAQEQHPVI